MKRSRMMSAFVAAAGGALWLAASPAFACEPIHDLLTFGEPTEDEVKFQCQSGQTVCPTDPQGNPLGPCLSCGSGGEQELCWASECRGFNGDTGQFGQFKKDVPGELEAMIIESWNLRTNQIVTIVETVANPTCTAQIPAPTAGTTCEGLYKVKSTTPIGGSSPGPLCTFDNLDDVNTIARTPASQNVIITDVNGRQCEARKKIGDQWWMFYSVCCSPASIFGVAGDEIATSITLVYDQDGTCKVTSKRADQTDPETIPSANADPCL